MKVMKLLLVILFFCISFFANVQQQNTSKIELYKENGYVVWVGEYRVTVSLEDYNRVIDSLWPKENPVIAFPEIPIEIHEYRHKEEYKTAFEKTRWKRWLNEFKVRVFDKEIDNMMKNVAETLDPDAWLQVDISFDSKGHFLSSRLAMSHSVFEVLTLEQSKILFKRSRNLGGTNGEPIPNRVLESIYVWDQTVEWVTAWEKKLVEYVEAFKQDTTNIRETFFSGNLTDYLMPLEERSKAHYGKFSISINYENGELQ